jgi:hypothetical protein
VWHTGVVDPGGLEAVEPHRQAIAERLVRRSSSEREALLVPKLAMACFQTAYERWVRDPDRDLPTLVDESFAALASLQAT